MNTVTISGNKNGKKSETLSFEPLEKAIASLENAVQNPPQNELERDGVIQRFEYTFELAWKSIRTLLISFGRPEVSSSPRPLLKEALSEGLIQSFENWNRYLEARNQYTQTYCFLSADEVYQIAVSFLPAAENLLSKIKSKVIE